MAPVDAFRLRPVGSIPPTIDQLYGTVPPLAVRVCEYEELTSTEGSDVVVMDGGGGTKVTVNASFTRSPVWAMMFPSPSTMSTGVKKVELGFVAAISMLLN